MSAYKATSLLDRVNDLESQLSDVAGLVSALEIVAWDFCQTTIEDRNLSRLRSAVVALSSSLDRIVGDGQGHTETPKCIPDTHRKTEAAA